MYHQLKSVIKDKYGQDACNVGDEGGFAPNIQSNLEGIELLMAAIKKAGYEDKVSAANGTVGSATYRRSWGFRFVNKAGEVRGHGGWTG